MRLSTSTGDFAHYYPHIADYIRALRGLKFKYINLEQCGSDFSCGVDADYARLAEEWGSAAEEAGVTFVISHAPCVNAFAELTEEHYDACLRAVRGSIEICGRLGIPRTVVHASKSTEFTTREFYEQNKRWYRDLIPTAERFGVMLLTENMDHDTDHPISTGKELRAFVEYIDHPLMGVCWDTAHANINPRSRAIGQYKNIVDIGDRLKGLHISDNFGDVHHHSWPFAGRINFDAVMQGLLDVAYDGYFNFEASYTLLHQNNPPYQREPFIYRGEAVTRLENPSISLKRMAVDLLYETGKHILTTYDCFEE